MPYIKTENRAKFEIILKWFLIRPELNNLSSGEINYLITKIIDRQLGFNPKYEDYNRMIGILEAVKLEFYRRQVAEYENKKKKENGDVYEKKFFE